jgi:tRNA nucleotidyltransferase (CCA-adding enzyme)
MYIPDKVLLVINKITSAGGEAAIVGGAVRDALKGQKPHDYDIAASCPPETTASLFSEYPLVTAGLRHGTVGVVIDGEELEITTYRRDGEYTDHRRPDSVCFTESLTEDLSRRDFTVCAMAYIPGKGLVDPFGGAEDLKNSVLRTVGEPRRRFREDALRIMRGVRFAAGGLTPESETAKAMNDMAHTLSTVSAERIWSELSRAAVCPAFSRAVLDFAPVITTVIPALAPSVGFEHHSIYHHLDVYEHTAAALAAAERYGYDDLAVRIALLLHDSGKPAACRKGEDGHCHFKGHGDISAELCRESLTALRVPRGLLERCVRLTAMHDTDIRPEREYMLRLMRALGREDAARLSMIRRCDNEAHAPGYNDGSDALRCLEMTDELADECYSVDRLNVKGSDIKALGAADKEIGEVLRALLDEVISQRTTNDRESLISAARIIMDR